MPISKTGKRDALLAKASRRPRGLETEAAEPGVNTQFPTASPDEGNWDRALDTRCPRNCTAQMLYDASGVFPASGSLRKPIEETSKGLC